MTELVPPRCVSCGGEYLSWRVHRTGTRLLQHSHREIQWSCRRCGHEWREALIADGEAVRPPPI